MMERHYNAETIVTSFLYDMEWHHHRIISMFFNQNFIGKKQVKVMRLERVLPLRELKASSKKWKRSAVVTGNNMQTQGSKI